MDISTHKHHFETNKSLWNKKTPIHEKSKFYDLEGFKAGKNMLTTIETKTLGNHVNGKSLLHLQCHFGLDSMSWSRMGAKVVGVDFSEEAINLARKINQENQLDAEFICCNVYDTRKYISKKFDIVFTSWGTIGWLPDLSAWAKVIADSLKPNGVFYIAEFHPVIWMFDDDFKEIIYPYESNKNVIEIELEGTYANKEAEIKHKEYSWNHSLSKVMTALIQEGLEIEMFQEHNFSPYNVFDKMIEVEKGKFQLEKHNGLLPMSYEIKARMA